MAAPTGYCARVSTTTFTRRRTVVSPYVPVAALAGAVAALTVALAVAMDLPIRDPDGIAGPAYVRLPLILGLMFLLDVLPRAAWRTRGFRGLPESLREVVREHWSGRRVVLVVVGLISFYLTYVAYRNLKSFLPFLRDGTADVALLQLDRAMAFGREPATLLHGLLGTGPAAHILSASYVFFLVFVPISLAAALVWTRDLARGFWYVTALCLNWVLGALSYYVLPSLGPVFARPALFDGLPATGVSSLQDMLWRERLEVLAGPWNTTDVHGIAGFASLHVAIVFTAALLAHLLGLQRFLRYALWIFLGMTLVSTVYFGWHYVIDDLAGLAIGGVAVWLGALATGHDVRGRFAEARA